MADEQNGNGGQGGKSASVRLSELLGFDPTKRPTVGPKGGELFKQALAEITKERDEKAKAQAAELFRKAISLAEERKKAVAAFNKADQAFEKELGKVLNQINGLVSGQETVEQEGEGQQPTA